MRKKIKQINSSFFAHLITLDSRKYLHAFICFSCAFQVKGTVFICSLLLCTTKLRGHCDTRHRAAEKTHVIPVWCRWAWSSAAPFVRWRASNTPEQTRACAPLQAWRQIRADPWALCDYWLVLGSYPRVDWCCFRRFTTRRYNSTTCNTSNTLLPNNSRRLDVVWRMRRGWAVRCSVQLRTSGENCIEWGTLCTEITTATSRQSEVN